MPEKNNIASPITNQEPKALEKSNVKPLELVRGETEAELLENNLPREQRKDPDVRFISSDKAYVDTNIDGNLNVGKAGESRKIYLNGVELQSGGGGAVESVNGKTGQVVLVADDIMVTNSTSVQANLERIDEEVEDLIDGKLNATKEAVSTVGGLVIPNTTPASEKLVGVDTANAQEMVSIGSGLSLLDGVLSATGGSGTPKYAHFVSLSVVNYRVVVLVICEKAENFTGETLADWLYNNGYLYPGGYYSVFGGGGCAINDYTITFPSNIFWNNGLSMGGTQATFTYNNATIKINYTESNNITPVFLSDRVIPLQ